MKTMGKWSYILGLVFTLFFCVLLRVRYIAMVRNAAPGANGALLLSIFFLALAFILMLWAYYKAYSAIRDEQSPRSPLKSAGYAAIPLFNIYWLFVMIPGFGKEYDLFLERQNKQLPSGRSWLYWVAAVAWLMAMYITKRPMGAVLLLFFMPFAMGKLANSVNRLNEELPAEGEEGVAPDQTAAEPIPEGEIPPPAETETPNPDQQ